MPRPTGIAFLLSQLGAHVTRRLAARLEELDLTPAHVGVLRAVGQAPGLSQRALSVQLEMLPSRMVTLLDDLERRGLVERRRSSTDRRHHEIHVAESGRPAVAAVMTAVTENDEDIVRGLSPAQQEQLRELLSSIAAEQGLEPGRHPG